jgi:hypothetical protein
MDDMMPGEDPSLHKGRPFTNVYFLPHNETLSKNNCGMNYMSILKKYIFLIAEFSSTPIVIYEMTRTPPHYKLILRNDVWEVFPGRHNLFHTIILFLLYIEIYQSGYLG